VFRAHGLLQGYPPECPFQRMDFRSQNTNDRQPPQSKNKFNATPSYGGMSSSQGPTFSPTQEYNQYNATSMYTPSAHTNTFAPPQPTETRSMGPPPPTFNPSPTNQFQPQNNPYNPMQQPDQWGGASQPSAYGMPPTNFNPPPPAPAQPFLTPSMPNHNMMQPAPPPVNDVGPPPSGVAAPISLKEAHKQFSPTAQPTQPTMNFFNPAANMPSQPQPNAMQPANPSMPSMPSGNTGRPNMMSGMVPPGRMTPGQTQLPPQPAKKQPEPAQPEVVKGPVPSEHVVLQQTFDAIVERCRNATNNPQTKRKLEDVRRRLEILYDLLRGLKVSANVLGGLHQMVQVCQQNDYMSGIQIHTHMISTGNFSEISSFMPGLKTMMQIANQLKI